MYYGKLPQAWNQELRKAATASSKISITEQIHFVVSICCEFWDPTKKIVLVISYTAVYTINYM